MLLPRSLDNNALRVGFRSLQLHREDVLFLMFYFLCGVFDVLF